MKSYFTSAIPFITLSPLLVFFGCTHTPPPVVGVINDLALRTSISLFDQRFDPEESQLLNAKEVKEWISKNNIEDKVVPIRVQKAVEQKSTVGLLVTEFITTSDKTFKRLSDTQRVLILWESQLDYGRTEGFWLNAIKPCNGDFCENCGGCEGKTDIGTISMCICTNSCGRCNACPPCEEGQLSPNKFRGLLQWLEE